MWASLIAFVLATLLLAVVPGPSTALLLWQAMRNGRRAALGVIAANEVGVLVWALLATFGLSAVMSASGAAYDIARVAGAVVLVVLGVRSLIPGRWERHDETPRRAVYSGFVVGLATILANPKAAIFAAAFLPQFVPRGEAAIPVLLTLSILWVVVDASWYLTLLAMLDRADGLLKRANVRRWLERLSGIVLIGLAARLAVVWD